MTSELREIKTIQEEMKSVQKVKIKMREMKTGQEEIKAEFKTGQEEINKEVITAVQDQLKTENRGD